MWATMVTGYTADRRDPVLVIIVELEEFLIDPAGHLEHFPGNIFFWFGVAGKIQMTGSAVRGRSMAKITFYTQSSLPGVHNLAQLFVGDIFGQHFQVHFFWLVFLGANCGHPGHHQGRKAEYNCNFLVMQHI